MYSSLDKYNDSDDEVGGGLMERTNLLYDDDDGEEEQVVIIKTQKSKVSQPEQRSAPVQSQPVDHSVFTEG